MKKRLLKAAIATALSVAFAVPAFANPFTDVPQKHWAYDAVNKLVQAGIVDGYGDGTFRGDKTMTRYEMAQIVAKAMTKNLNAGQKEVVDQLSKEFATELNAMGVKVEGMQKQLNDMVKVSGDARLRYGSIDNGAETIDYRARVTFSGKIADDMKFSARLTTDNVSYDNNAAIGIKLDTANVTFNALGLTSTIGRQDMVLGTGTLYDSRITGLSTQIGGLKLFGGNTNSAERVYAAEYTTNILGAKVTADYLKNDTQDSKVYGANASFGLMDGITANAEYYKNDKTSATAAAYGVKFDKLGLSAIYRNIEANALSGYTTLVDVNGFDTTVETKGMEYQYDKALNKNTKLNVKYQDFDNQEARTSAVVNVKF